MKKAYWLVFFFFLLSPVIQATPVPAPDINLPGLTGEFRLSELKGKVVYLDFWASWCKPCKKSFPWLHDMKKKFADQGFEVATINLDKERALADTFLKAFDINFIVGFDSEGKTAAEYKLRGMPSSFMIGRDGNIYASHVGFRDKDKEKLEEAIRRLLAAEYK